MQGRMKEALNHILSLYATALVNLPGRPAGWRGEWSYRCCMRLLMFADPAGSGGADLNVTPFTEVQARYKVLQRILHPDRVGRMVQLSGAGWLPYMRQLLAETIDRAFSLISQPGARSCPPPPSTVRDANGHEMPIRSSAAAFLRDATWWAYHRLVDESHQGVNQRMLEAMRELVGADKVDTRTPPPHPKGTRPSSQVFNSGALPGDHDASDVPDAAMDPNWRRPRPYYAAPDHYPGATYHDGAPHRSITAPRPRPWPRAINPRPWPKVIISRPWIGTWPCSRPRGPRTLGTRLRAAGMATQPVRHDGN
mmetsp:Transcript_11800/g.35520  ORF Transcript_11800/g.35520 Transcript_11800/m.35520 type:complete len:309 (+) Transcript_11800:304-1230(+)